MDSDALRAAQQPLKDRYRADPDAALVTLTAEGSLGEGITCSVATGRAMVEAGLHPATGGTGALACSGDMLLEALVACAGVTLRSVATSLEMPVTGTVRELLEHAERLINVLEPVLDENVSPLLFIPVELRRKI